MTEQELRKYKKKLCLEDAVKIITRLSENKETQEQIAKDFGVSSVTVSLIDRRKLWESAWAMVTGEQYCKHGKHYVPVGTVKMRNISKRIGSLRTVLHRKMCNECYEKERAK